MVKFLHRSDLSRKVAVVVGTRPGIVKMSPILRSLRSTRTPFFLIHTGQHYSRNMDRHFFSDLRLPHPKYTVRTTRHFTSHAGQTAEMMKGVEAALLQQRPAITIVGGDANTNLAGALAARKLRIAVAHVEAGLRSHDWLMPEEHNRVMIDHISDFLFPPTRLAERNLIKERVHGRITVVGNTIADAIKEHSAFAEYNSSILRTLSITSNNYIVLTLHREENVDSRARLTHILQGVKNVSDNTGLPIIFPVHPRTQRQILEFGLSSLIDRMPTLRRIPPTGYLDFIRLLMSAKLVMSDSGGLQEEACILRVPCVTLRDNTERPETLEVGANMLAGTSPRKIFTATKRMLRIRRSWRNPFGNGQAGARIVSVLRDAL